MRLLRQDCWELSEHALLYEAPPELDEVDLHIGTLFQQDSDELAAKGHQLEPTSRGNLSGHTCVRCKKINKTATFNDWFSGSPCSVKPTGRERKASVEADFTRCVKAQRLAKAQAKPCVYLIMGRLATLCYFVYFFVILRSLSRYEPRQLLPTSLDL